MSAMRLRVTGAIAVAALMGVAAPAVGAGDTVKSEVKITEGGPDHFGGKVTSDERKCKKGREVTLEYKYGGPYKRGAVVGTDKTNKKGKWEIDGAFQAGLYRAVVEEDEAGNFTCGFDRSIRMEF